MTGNGNVGGQQNVKLFYDVEQCLCNDNATVTQWCYYAMFDGRDYVATNDYCGFDTPSSSGGQ